MRRGRSEDLEEWSGEHILTTSFLNRFEGGMIYLVGAGPGDPGLLTIRALELIQQADVLVFDALVNPEIVALGRAEARRISVGKRAYDGSLFQRNPSCRTVTTKRNRAVMQEEINVLLRDLHFEYGEEAVIVRLKGGDPLVFGRGGDEAEFLQRAGIPFEIVPGISSALAAPAYAGIPVTQRGLSDGVLVITGSSRGSGAPVADFEALGRLSWTLVILMGMENMPAIFERLMKGGRPSSTPAAVVQWATWPMQTVALGTLETLPNIVQKRGIASPGVIIVGEAAAKAEKLNWLHRRRLQGIRIHLTRPSNHQREWLAAFRREGAQVLTHPVVERIEFPDVLDEFLRRQLEPFSDIAFTSRSGVEIFAQEIQRREQDGRILSGKRVSAVGAGTRRALWETMRIKADLVPPESSARSLLKTWQREKGNSKRSYLVVGARNSRLLSLLREASDEAISFCACYETVPREDPEVFGYYDRNEIDLVLLASPSAVEGLARNLRLSDGDVFPAEPEYVAIGKTTAEAVEKRGIEPLIAASPGIEDILKTCIEAAERHHDGRHEKRKRKKAKDKGKKEG
ncbi:MAG: uroporphyrinogen-III C-methyltransferase [Candidatus Hydrogenedentota bacterium]|nr:MAG: uroporphyrinogen-III C-methyltransferase [Candidatus Hydrogenedentota bacterium]